VNKTGPDFTSRSKPEIEDTVMNRTAFAIAAALLAGTTLTSAANAGGLRVGFGFPLGSFIAHSNQNYSDNDYGCRHCDRPHYAARHVYEDDAPVHKVKHTPKVDTAEVSQPTTTAKLEDKLVTDAATTTEIAKTTTSDTGSTPTTTSDTTTASTDTTTSTPTATHTPKIEKVATVDNKVTTGKTDVTTVAADTKQVCRRYSATIAGLVDVPCE
jgi:hypothetical protein